jgi:transglutaminase-like putative cysteine protease
MEKSAPPAQEDRFWDWSCAILTFLLIQVSAARLLVTAWTPNLFLAGTLGGFGVALGLALGISLFGRRTVLLLSTLYTAVLLPLQLSNAFEDEASLGERLASFGGRLWFSYTQFIARKPVEDTILFVAFISLVYWLIGLTAGYSLTRHKNALGIILPAGAATLIIHSYDNFVPIRLLALALLIFLSLVLLGRMYFANNQDVWKKRRVFVPSEAALDIQNHLLIVASIAVLISWLLPASLSSLEGVANSWNNATQPIRERFSLAVSALESPYGSGKESEFYGDRLDLGRYAALGDTPVFTVKINTKPVDSPPRFYWRGRVYDTYSAGRWSNSDSRSINFDPRFDELILPPYGERQPLRATITLEISRQGLIYAPSETFWTNRPGKVFTASTLNHAQDLAAWTTEPILSAGERYVIRAMIANPTITELRAAGRDYPEWVTRRYLQVPDEIAQQISRLAEQITRGQLTPYDQATAITTFLRNEIGYSTELAPLPRNQDPLLWILFDTKKGFCMYYASAEVLMLRSIGIPARLAVGFAQGDLEAGVYTVLREDSHAWPEVYFPGVGWVEFEPTANQEPLSRPFSSRTSSTPQDNQGQGLELPPSLAEQNTGEQRAEDNFQNAGTASRSFITTPQAGSLVIGLFVLTVIFLYLNSRYRMMSRMPVYLTRVYARNDITAPRWLERWANWSVLTSIERSFQAINLCLRWMGKPPPLYATSAQRAKALQVLLPSSKDEIEILLNEHQTALYSAHKANYQRARRASFKIVFKTILARLRKS